MLVSVSVSILGNLYMTGPASGTVKKVIEINPYLLGTMAGGAGEWAHPSIFHMIFIDLLKRIANIGKRILACIADSMNSGIASASPSRRQAST